MNITNRQFQDIQAMADRVRQGRDFEGAVEQLAQYSEELKEYLQKFTENEMVLVRLARLPKVDFDGSTFPLKKRKNGLLDFLFSLLIWFSFGIVPILWRDYRRKEKVIEQVNEIASIYASIHFLLQHELDY